MSTRYCAARRRSRSARLCLASYWVASPAAAMRHETAANLTHSSTRRACVCRPLMWKQPSITPHCFSSLRRKGRAGATNDLWIGAVALQHGYAVLSLDAHFSAMDNLLSGSRIEDFLPEAECGPPRSGDMIATGCAEGCGSCAQAAALIGGWRPDRGGDRRRLTAPTFVAQLANLFPGSGCELRVQALPLKVTLRSWKEPLPILRIASTSSRPCSINAFKVVCSRSASRRASWNRLSEICMVFFHGAIPVVQVV
jgi:hypothetical protein